MRGLSARSPATLVLAASGWMALEGNLPLWRELAALGLANGALVFALAGVVAACLVALLSLVAWRGLLKPAIALLLVVCAASSHFMLRYHVVIDAGMLQNALQTDRSETAALLDATLLPVLLFGAVLPAWAVWRWPVNYRPAPAQLLRNLLFALGALAAAAVIVLLTFQPLAGAMRGHKQLRYLMNPLNTLWAAGQLAWRQPQRAAAPVAPLGRDARLAAGASARPAMLVLVLGETGRSGNFGLNGYPRPTTPQLQALGVASFRNAWSCGTSTAASVPCMFSHLGREAFNAREGEHENLLDVLQHAGLAVLWLDNQSGCKGVCERVPHDAACPAGDCLDEAMLQGLDERIARLPAQQRARGVVLVLHQMGSHGPAYWQRSPQDAKRFLPECRTIALNDCTREELVNAYDNSIAYTDRFLASTVGWLQRQAAYDTAMLYVSDHGESLGEGNVYLHGMPWALAPDVQKHVPWVSWLSPGFSARTGVAMECLRSRAGERLTHDSLFHSVLGLMQVETSAYRRALDPYAACAAH